MISNYYSKQYKSQFKNTKAIKLKNNQKSIEEFIIPEQHFKSNKQQYEALKSRCQGIKSQFSFIKSQIQRQHDKKKQKRQHFMKMGKDSSDSSRSQAHRAMSNTCRRILRLNQSRKEILHQNMRQRLKAADSQPNYPLTGQALILREKYIQTHQPYQINKSIHENRHQKREI